MYCDIHDDLCYTTTRRVAWPGCHRRCPGGQTTVEAAACEPKSRGAEGGELRHFRVLGPCCFFFGGGLTPTI